ncbi:hypothetical protein SO802_021033 [Lithocarpus litseifolius]|uniref:ADP-ribosyl cyclase/cyclic ADP-ribose hydrolase n=1 Tax=Lithocarpus litseifolius TaxID=425828 RepID=A0AAW2CG55_9ROSI
MAKTLVASSFHRPGQRDSHPLSSRFGNIFHMASSSSFSSTTPSWKYNVFLSFRGEETRNTFTDHLYDALKKKGIITFRDEEKLETGKSISSELFKAIEDSRIALVILSKNYASSTWCLDELRKIVDCMKEKGMTVLPVFYDVDPSDVRKQLKNFEKAFVAHEERFKENMEKVEMWKNALTEVANLKGWHLVNRIDNRYYNWRYDMFIPGSVIPKWFRYQSMGSEVNIKEPSSHLCTNEWMGIAVCVVFGSLPHHLIMSDCLMSCQLIVNGNNLSATPNIGRKVGSSDHIWLLYLLNQYYKELAKDIKLLKECEANEFNQIGIKIGTNSKMEVKKCGFRMVYKKDIEDLNQTMSQSSNTSIIPYEDLGVLHHNSDNSMVVGDGNIAKRTRDDYDGVGPSGEGTSNDMPNPKRIERLPEFKTHGNSDCPESSMQKSLIHNRQIRVTAGKYQGKRESSCGGL